MNEGDQFCPNCGANISGTPHRVHTESRRREREACFGPPGSGVGLWGAISGGMFLIGLIVLWYYDWWWPGVLFLIALMAIIGGIVSYTRR
jgi:hypothetical protein